MEENSKKIKKGKKMANFNKNILTILAHNSVSWLLIQYLNIVVHCIFYSHFDIRLNMNQ